MLTHTHRLRHALDGLRHLPVGASGGAAGLSKALDLAPSPLAGCQTEQDSVEAVPAPAAEGHI